MITSDISRFLVQPHKKYAGVRQQQGRLFTDADHNENAALREEQLSLATCDLLGPRATPDNGFSLGTKATEDAQVTALSRGQALSISNVTLGGETFTSHRLWIRPGSVFVGGKRYEELGPEPFLFQRDYLQMRRENVPFADPLSQGDFAHLYLLHAFEQEVSAVEDPELLEPALGGADTSTRIRRMRRVEAFTKLPTNITSIDGAYSRFIAERNLENADIVRTTGELRSRARLQLLYPEAGTSQTPCAPCNPQPMQRLLGANNVTLRLMLAESNRFVWSENNSAPLYRILLRGKSSLSDSDVTKRFLEVEMLTPPFDETAWPMPGRVVELLPFGAILEGPLPDGERPAHAKKVAERVGAFLRARTGYSPLTRRFTLELEEDAAKVMAFVTTFEQEHPEAARLNVTADSETDAVAIYCRFWHDSAGQSSPTIPIEPGIACSPLGNTGLRPVFHKLGRRGDFWIAALRPEQPRPVIPFDLTDKPYGVPPHGPRDYYVPLALITGHGNTIDYCADARQGIGRSVDTGCVTYTVGDGLQSQGDFTHIQEAIDALPAEGGHILVRRGTYRERLKLEQIDHVTLEACGEEVVIETPPTDPNDPALASNPKRPLIDIRGCQGIRIGGFRLHAAQERAVLVRESERGRDILLVGLTVRSFVRRGWPLLPGADSVDHLPLIELEPCLNVVISNVVLEPTSRQALLAKGSRLNFAGLTVVSDAKSALAPTEPLVQLQNCDEVLFEESTITAHGREGLHIATSTNVVLRQLSMIVSRHCDAQNKISQSRSAIGLDAVENLRLLSSWLTMDESPSDHAALVVLGKDVTIAKSHFEVLARCHESPSPSPHSPSDCTDLRVQAYGGIQLCGGCRNIELRENQILGGIGHGITLGSLHFYEIDDEGESLGTEPYRFGAGSGQMTAREDGHLAVTGLLRLPRRGRYENELVAVDDGPLIDIRILDNRIEQMNGSGISVITVLGFPDADSLVEVLGLRIAGNTIIDNLRHPAENIELAAGFGVSADSIAGGAASSASLQSLTERQASVVSVLPLGGIVIAAATAMDIEGNTISGNGNHPTIPTNGIYVLLGEAIRIANNRIGGNGGRASIDSPQYSPPPAPLPGIRAGIAVMLAGTGTSATPFAEDPTTTLSGIQALFDDSGRGLDSGGPSLRILGNTVRHPEGRALHVVSAGPVAIVGNFLSSEGNHGADTVSDAYQVGDVVYVQNLGSPWESGAGGIAAGALASRDTPENAEQYLSFDTTRAVYGDGGAIQFKDNQVTFDWEVLRVPHLPRRRPPLSLFPVALVSLDHVSIDNCQFAFRLRGRHARAHLPESSPVLRGFTEPVFGHVLAVGGTVQVNNNRIAESVGSAILSLVALGQLASSVSYNQCTHELLVMSNAYDTVTQTAALRTRYQGRSPSRAQFIHREQPTSDILILNPDVCSHVAKVRIDVKRTGSTSATEPANRPSFAVTYLIPGESANSGEIEVLSGESFVSADGDITLPLSCLTLRIAAGQYTANDHYEYSPVIPLAKEGTEPPELSVPASILLEPGSPPEEFPAKRILQQPAENAELEIRITRGGTLGSQGDLAPLYRYRLRGGEPWSGELTLVPSITIPSSISGKSLVTVHCSSGAYSTDNVYRLSTYAPVSQVRRGPHTNAPVNAELAPELFAPNGAHRVLLKVYQSGTIDSANSNVPECRFSLNGGLSWSEVLPVKAHTVLGNTGLSLNFERAWESLSPLDYFEFESYLPHLSRDLWSPWLLRSGNQVLFRPQGTALNLPTIERLMRFSKRFVTLLSKVSS